VKGNVVHLADVRARRKAPKRRPSVDWAAQLNQDGSIDFHVEARNVSPAEVRRLGHDLVRLARAAEAGKDGS